MFRGTTCPWSLLRGTREWQWPSQQPCCSGAPLAWHLRGAGGGLVLCGTQWRGSQHGAARAISSRHWATPGARGLQVACLAGSGLKDHPREGRQPLEVARARPRGVQKCSCRAAGNGAQGSCLQMNTLDVTDQKESDHGSPKKRRAWPVTVTGCHGSRAVARAGRTSACVRSRRPARLRAGAKSDKPEEPVGPSLESGPGKRLESRLARRFRQMKPQDASRTEGGCPPGSRPPCVPCRHSQSRRRGRNPLRGAWGCHREGHRLACHPATLGRVTTTAPLCFG